MVGARKSKDWLRRMILIAMFGALSYVVMLTINFRVSFLTMDVKDVVIALAGLYIGPSAAIVLSLFVPFLEMITMSETGLYGFAMNAIGTAAFAVTVSVIYKYKKNLLGAVIGLVSGAVLMVAVMMGFNVLVTPFYLHSLGSTLEQARQTVFAMLPTVLLPFNVIKGALNVGLLLLLYKPMSRVIQRVGILPRSESGYRMDWRTALTLIAAVVLITGALVYLFVALDGVFEWGWLIQTCVNAFQKICSFFEGLFHA